MVRKYVRKSDRGKWNAEDMMAAVEMVSQGAKLRTAAGACNVPRTTLRRHLEGRLIKASGSKSLGRVSTLGKENEEDLVQHILEFERRGFPLTTMDIRKMAYEFVVDNGLPNPFCKEKKAAGKDWWIGFRRRHRHVLTIRKPQALSIQRAINLNKPVVERYFHLLEDVMTQFDLLDKPTRIYNMDESGLSLVPGVKNIVGQLGSKSSSQITSGERGLLQTVLLATNAAGDYIPPLIVYKGKRKMPQLERDLPPGSMVRLSDSGYINKELFLEWIEHFCQNRKERDGKTLLVLDGHGSHTQCMAALKYASVRGVEIISMPAHTSHYLQPLDKVHFKPLKDHYKEAVRIHVRNNPGVAVGRTDFPQLFTKAYFKIATIENSVNAFRATGLFPLDMSVIPERAYAPAETTNRPPDTDTVSEDEDEEIIHQQPDAGVPDLDELPADVAEVDITVTPVEHQETDDANDSVVVDETANNSSFENILPFPKVGSKRTRTRRQGISTGVRHLTGSEYLCELETYQEEKAKKQKQGGGKSKATEERPTEKASSKGKGCGKKTTKGKEGKGEKKKAQKSKKSDEPEASTSGTGQPRSRRRPIDKDDPSNICGVCNGNYYDDDCDDSEDWIECPKCSVWFHETCAGVFGRAAYDFICMECAG